MTDIQHRIGNKPDWRLSVPTETGDVMRTGYLTVGVFIGLFGLWAITFPLSSAVVARGTVISNGQNKLIQHPTGGSITKIHVADGETVRKGDPVVTLDPVVDQAEVSRLSARLFAQIAARARLEALLAGKQVITFPQETQRKPSSGLRSSFDSGIVSYSASSRKIMANQIQEFEAAQKSLNREINALTDQKKALAEQLKGFQARRRAASQQRSMLGRQVRKVRPLVKQGYIARVRVDELEQRLSELNASEADIGAQVLATRHRIAEIDHRIEQIIATTRQKIAADLTNARVEIEALENQIVAAQRIYEQRQLRAPVTGIVSKLTIHTIGGVIKPNETIAEIVPNGGGYMVEAMIMPQDVDNVLVGQPAEVLISAFNSRLYDAVKAKVVYVAADSALDEAIGERFYTARLKLDEKPVAGSPAANIRAGMQGEVFIQAGSRVFLSYLMKPVADSFRRAFREE